MCHNICIYIYILLNISMLKFESTKKKHFLNNLKPFYTRVFKYMREKWSFISEWFAKIMYCR